MSTVIIDVMRTDKDATRLMRIKLEGVFIPDFQLSGNSSNEESFTLNYETLLVEYADTSGKSGTTQRVKALGK